MSWQTAYMARFYDRSKGWTDGTTEFHAIIKRLASEVPGKAQILEIGSGPSNPSSRFLATLGEVHGLDVDPDVKHNDALASVSVLEGETYPFESGRFDLAASNYVLEHVENPQAHLREVARVLKPGGVYVWRTPNLFHYVALVSWLTPHWFHLLVSNRLRGMAAEDHDPYPTFYAMNTARTVQRLADEAGFTVETLRLVEKEPSYGFVARPLFLALMAYERAVNATELAAGLRSNLFGVLRRR